MHKIFLTMLNLNLLGSYLLLAVFVVRFLLRKAPKKVICFLWLLVGLRFLLPIYVESAFGLFPKRNFVEESTVYENVPVVESGLTVFDHAVNAQIRDRYDITASMAPWQLWEKVCICGWLTGIAVLALYFLFSWWKLKRIVKTAVPQECCKEKVYFCETITMPFLMGLVRPRIYIPKPFDEEALPYVIAHEKAHRERKDHVVKVAAFFLAAVYWFNPLVWIGYILLCRDMEYACDEKVIGLLGAEQKKDYSTALLRCTVGKRELTWCPTAFGEVGVKHRIIKVLNYKKPAVWLVAAAVVVCLSVALCFMTQKKQSEQSENMISYDGCEIYLKEAVACEEVTGMKMTVGVRAKGKTAEEVEALWARAIVPQFGGSWHVKRSSLQECELHISGIYFDGFEQALTMRLSDGTELGTFSSEAVIMEEAEQFETDSSFGKVKVTASPHFIKVTCDDGIPKKKNGGILIMETTEGEQWKVTRIPMRVSDQSEPEFDAEVDFAAGAMDESMIGLVLDEALDMNKIKSFSVVSSY